MGMLANIINAMRGSYQADMGHESKLAWVVDNETYPTRDAALKAMFKGYAERTGEKLDPNSVQDRFKLFGFPETLEQRRMIAPTYGIWRYEGTAEQNEALMARFTDDVLGPA